MLKALLLENVHPLAASLLRGDGTEVVTRTGAMDEDELIAALDGVQLLGIRSKTEVTRRVIENAPDLVAIGTFTIGTNQIDLAVAEIPALTRRLTERDKALHAGVWDKSADGAHEVRGRTLGIVGYGNIGTQLSVLAESLGMSVVFYDVAERLALGNARRMSTLDELLAVADVVTLHVDGRAGNAGMFGRHQFATMRPGA
ncbi:MAG TPA: NAD(P)-dependent oxidoreductase, partial [Actinotalea sp.]|nr:NAD(P)-dependent oxidoreductase [Actinotalea sp.]